MEVRLQKFLADAGVASRRASEQIIVAGRVTVNGKPAKELGTKVDPDKDHVSVDGRPLKPKRKLYLAVHRPIEVTLRAWKNREARRLCETQGMPVGKHQRTQIGPIKLGELPKGRWRTLTGAEIESLISSAQ